MSTLTLSLGSLALILLLIGLRVPIGVSMGAVAFCGLWYLRNLNVAMSVLRDTPFVFAANWDLSAIPMFLLMGAVAGNSGIGTALFRTAVAWFGALPGGLAVATNWACAGFGAASGSSVAAAAVMARLAIPEMLKHKYDKGLATGVCASGGTLDALIPPSIAFVIYGIFAEVSIVKLLLAGILPGILTATVYMIMIVGRALAQSEGRSAHRVRGPRGALARALGVAGRNLADRRAHPRRDRRPLRRRGHPDRGRCGGRASRRGHRVDPEEAQLGGDRRQLQGRHRHHVPAVLRRHRCGDLYQVPGACRLRGDVHPADRIVGDRPDPARDRRVDHLRDPWHVPRSARHDPAHHPGVRADVRGAEAGPRLVRRAGREIHRHRPAHAAGRFQRVCGEERGGRLRSRWRPSSRAASGSSCARSSS